MLRTVVFVCAVVLGAALMSFEMVASRLLAPYFGTGINTWAALISMVLLSIMLGYMIGGWLVDRFPTLALVGGFAAISGAWLLFVPTFGRPILQDLMLSVESEVTGVLIGAAVLLLLPITALGTYSPIALRLLLRTVGTSGRTSARIYAVSAIGNIAGTLGTVLILIPKMGVDAITSMLGWIVLGCAVLLFLTAWLTRRPGEATAGAEATE